MLLPMPDENQAFVSVDFLDESREAFAKILLFNGEVRWFGSVERAKTVLNQLSANSEDALAANRFIGQLE